MKNIVTWYGQPILNLDQRNEAEAYLRAEIDDLTAKIDEERKKPFGVMSMAFHYYERRSQLRDNLEALFRAKFVNPNEGMLL